MSGTNFMENRNANAKTAILQKLRKNQDFLMNTQVSSKPGIWTKWHQERVMNQEMDCDVNGLPNQRYIAVSCQSDFHKAC